MAQVRRLGPDDVAVARRAFTMMDEVFEADSEPLSDRYLADLLSRADFWALAAHEADEVLGAITGHVLPMTRREASELFVYDLAVRPEAQRRGIATELVRTLVAQAAAGGIEVVFVPADDEDEHALAFYRAVGGRAAPVTMFDLGAG